MRRAIMMLTMLCLVGSAYAVQDPVGNRFNPGPKGLGDGATAPRTGGDTIESATVISSLPYTDTGATCGYTWDYTDCVYNAGAPDVVYAYTASMNGPMNVSLCGSEYDTALWVYAGGLGNTVGCNDDFCGLQSEIDNIMLTAGLTYYIVVSGYSTACGTYTLNVTSIGCDPVFCPAGSVPEGEPDCYDGYVDNYNGGCNSTGWTVVEASGDGTADICGRSGTYLYGGSSYRDTDWYDAVGSGQVATIDCVAGFALQIIFIYGTNCSNLQYDYTQVPCDTHAVLSRTVASGVHFWPWVGPSVFSGVYCGDTYWMHLSGLTCCGPVGACCLADGSCIVQPESQCSGVYQGEGTGCDPNPCGTPTQRTTWGTIKDLYR